ncbi:MAG: hypothetical protein AAGI01_02785 [Myxococcota bacterium]
MSEMSKGAKVALGMLALAPAVSMLTLLGIVIMSAMLRTVFGDVVGEVLDHPAVITLLGVVFISSKILMFVQSLCYIMHAFMKNPRLTHGTQKVRWAAALFLFSLFAIPAYFFVHIWPDNEARVEDSFNAFS